MTFRRFKVWTNVTHNYTCKLSQQQIGRNVWPSKQGIHEEYMSVYPQDSKRKCVEFQVKRSTKTVNSVQSRLKFRIQRLN